MINESGYEDLRRQYRYLASDNQQLISYVFRCFWVGDEEEYQIHGDEEDIIKQQYLDAIRSIGSPEADQCIDAITEHLSGINTGHLVIDILDKHIWNKQLFNYDSELWFSIIFDEEYKEYASKYCQSEKYQKYMEDKSGLRTAYSYSS